MYATEGGICVADPAELTNYDSIVEDYIAHTERPNSWNNLYERPYMLSKLRSLQDKHVLDLGCGSGFLTWELKLLP